MGIFSKLIGAADTITNFGIGPWPNPTTSMTLHSVPRIVALADLPDEGGSDEIRWGNGPGGTTLMDHRLLRFPPAEQWPLPGRIEVYGNRGRRDDSLPALRQQRISVGARLLTLEATNYRDHGRQTGAAARPDHFAQYRQATGTSVLHCGPLFAPPT